MGVPVGIVIGFIGVGILLAPFIIQIYIRSKQKNNNYKRSLRAASVIIGIAIAFYIGGIILAGYFSGKSIAKPLFQYAGMGGKLVEENPELLA